jgi:hypothetical protein
VRATRIARFATAAGRAIGLRRDYVAGSIYEKLQHAVEAAETANGNSDRGFLGVDEIVTLALE